MALRRSPCVLGFILTGKQEESPGHRRKRLQHTCMPCCTAVHATAGAACNAILLISGSSVLTVYVQISVLAIWPVQAGGRLLTYQDIALDLQGKRAELYWPDDNLWYLISIEVVDLLTQRASIMYSTGETEELNLNDIVKEGHMSLVPDR